MQELSRSNCTSIAATVVCVCMHAYYVCDKSTITKIVPCTMKALKCKTLGGIHMQSTHTLALCIYCACAYECLAAPSRPSPVSRLFTPVAPVASL